jgi:hypothetical protein
MATITFSMASTPLTASKVFTGTDGDMQDLLDWAKATYFPPINGVPQTPTNVQVGAALANATIAAWKAVVVKFKNDAAHAAIVSATPSTWA